MTQSFRGRLTAATISLVLLTAGGVGLTALRVSRGHLVEEMARSLRARTRLLIPGVPRAALSARRVAELDRWAVAAAGRTGARVTLIALEGKVLGDSEVPTDGLSRVESHATRPEVLQALHRGAGSDVRKSRTVGVEFLYVALPVLEAGKPAGVLRLAMPLTEVRARAADLRRAILAAGLACLAVSLLLAVLVSRSFHRPVASLAEAADRIAGGDFDARAETGAGGELGRLAEVLNTLADRVAAMLGELGEEKAQLKTTLDNMVEGVALLDADGRVQELNPIMERLFDLRSEETCGRPLAEALRHSALQDLVRKALEERRPGVGEATLFTPEERVFEAYANPVLDGAELKGAVLVLHDITRLRRLEEVRKEFVANVSHELRTPLASIKGFAETLRRGGIDDKEHRMEFVSTIESHADRLSRLVDDLLDLAAIESGRVPRTEPVGLAALVRETLEGLSPLAAKKEVRLENAVPEPLSAAADRSALRQVLENLIDNAIKYNRARGKVHIAARAEGAEVELAVSDTGAGIPAKDLPRVFERFYRVDKARSLEQGSTGLGLSIVKHLVESNGGRVWAESVEGEGATFFVRLPAA